VYGPAPEIVPEDATTLLMVAPTEGVSVNANSQLGFQATFPEAIFTVKLIVVTRLAGAFGTPLAALQVAANTEGVETSKEFRLTTIVFFTNVTQLVGEVSRNSRK
jgi:hypothetical protein